MRFGRVRRNLKPLGVQLVLLDHFHSNRLKRSQSNMQGNLGGLDAALANALQNFRREVQARRRRGHRAGRLGVDRLILLAIFGCVGAVDVRRQRNVPDAVEDGEEIVDRIEAQMALAERPAPDDLGCQFVRRFVRIAAEIDALAQAELAAGMHQRLPFQRRSGELFRQQHLDFAAQKISCGRIFLRQPLRARAAAMSVQPRRQHLGIVEDQQIVGPQQLGKVAKLPVRQDSSLRVRTCSRREAARSASGCRAISSSRKVVVEVGNQHTAIFAHRSETGNRLVIWDGTQVI